MTKDELDDIYEEFYDKCYKDHIEYLKNKRLDVIHELDEIGSKMKDYINDIPVEKIKMPSLDRSGWIWASFDLTIATNLINEYRSKLKVIDEKLEEEK